MQREIPQSAPPVSGTSCAGKTPELGGKQAEPQRFDPIFYAYGVNPKNFAASPGRVVKTPGPHGYWAYHPAPLPESIDLPASTLLLLSEADRALGRLAGSGRLLANPHLLLHPSIAREATASNRIEGTQASVSDVFDAHARRAEPEPLREVINYIRALEYGLDRLEMLPISTRFLCEVHAILLADVRGQAQRPGELRTTQNWIGPPGCTLEQATFVPPPPDEMVRAMSDLERFIHSQAPIPPLVQIALIHNQFETIHPYLDGNGRLGRLLITFLLSDRQLLPCPLLQMSAFFELRRSEYYHNLQTSREKGTFIEWIDFFLEGVLRQATEAINQSEALADLRERYRTRLTGDRSRAIEVVDIMFHNPVLVASQVAAHLGSTNQSALNYLRRLEQAGLIREVAGVPGRSKRWVAEEVFRILAPGEDIGFF